MIFILRLIILSLPYFGLENIIFIAPNEPTAEQTNRGSSFSRRVRRILNGAGNCFRLSATEHAGDNDEHSHSESNSFNADSQSPIVSYHPGAKSDENDSLSGNESTSPSMINEISSSPSSPIPFSSDMADHELFANELVRGIISILE